MKNTKNIIFALTIPFALSTANATDFSWYKMKKSNSDTNMFQANNSAQTAQAKKESATQSRIWDQYNVYSEKKSVKDVIEDRDSKALQIGFEMNSHSPYTVSTNINTVDANGNPVVVVQNAVYQPSNFAITVKGKTNLTELGIPGGRVNTKVALGNEHIDMDISKSIVDTESFSLDLGLGMKAVHQASPAWSEGFHLYVTTGAEYNYDNFNVSAGARIMTSKPEYYDSKIIPYLGASFSF